MATKQETQDAQDVIGAKADGDFGPKSVDALVGFLRAHGFMKPKPLPSGARGRVVALALGELGDQDPQRYIRDAAPVYIGQPPNAKAWCGIFALWCLRQAGLSSKVWVDGRGFAVGYLPITRDPEPGDVAYFGGKLSHYAVVERVEPVPGYAAIVHTIDGNTLPAPREGVTQKQHRLGSLEAAGGCYFSIRNLAT